ncbi:polyadenylate-binding protein-interacting protein 7 isoform X2 [Musa acuminata AAA Group]|uniref:polyadenylate-binding protein-interacting protein 7 isoform X2 n=1 Tax=Musa acuminata AAA Group TaxID=214697 RepID=UPI0031D2E206
MNMSDNGLSDKEGTKLNLWNKVTTLNPNALEFIPSSLKYAKSTKSLDTKKFDGLGSSGKSVFNQSGSTISNNSEGEANPYWYHQLPDDITPDFKVMAEELQGPGNLRIADLSLHDAVGPSRLSGSMANQLLGVRKDVPCFTSENHRLSEKICAEEKSPTAFMASAASSWGKPFINGEKHSRIGRMGCRNDGDFCAGPINDLTRNNMLLENAAVDPIKYLSSCFPGCDAQRLANVYYKNGCDLNSTIELISHYMHEVDSGFDQNLNVMSLASSRVSMLDSTALSFAETYAQSGSSKYNREDIRHNPIMHRSTSSISKGDMKFASTIRQLGLQDFHRWRSDRNGCADGHVGSESRREDHNVATLRNKCFEMENQTYYIGDKVLAKELGSKEQLYNRQTGSAHGKAEAICQTRNPLFPEHQSYSQLKDQVIDLYGLSVTEAMQSLNNRLSFLRRKARSSGQRLHAIICIGVGQQHSKGTGSPAWLPLAVEQYLTTEGLQFTQPHPGLLRVVIY